jgi:hypothetical protein
MLFVGCAMLFLLVYKVVLFGCNVICVVVYMLFCWLQKLFWLVRIVCWLPCCLLDFLKCFVGFVFVGCHVVCWFTKVVCDLPYLLFCWFCHVVCWLQRVVLLVTMLFCCDFATVVLLALFWLHVVGV